jgi:hypothetical protein
MRLSVMRMSARESVVGLVLVLVACGVADDDTGAAGDDTTTTADSSTTTTIGITPTSEELMEDDASLVQAATRDLSARLGIPEDEIEVVEAKEVQWPDGALGCPEEGKMYTQAVVEGTQVILGANERVYDYHAGADGEPFLCPSEEKDGGYEFTPPPGMP